MKQPGRDIPRAMIGGVLLVLAIYLSLNVAFLRVVPIGDMAGDPFVAATAAAHVFGPRGDTIIRVLMIVSMIAAVNACQLMASRVPLAMSRDGLLPRRVTRVNAGGTPVPSLMLGTLAALAFILTGTFDAVLALLAFFFVADYTLSFVSLFVLRWREPDLPRPFRVPGYPWLPGIALVGSLAFLVGAVLGDRANSLRALALLALAVAILFLGRGGPGAATHVATAVPTGLAFAGAVVVRIVYRRTLASSLPCFARQRWRTSPQTGPRCAAPARVRSRPSTTRSRRRASKAAVSWTPPDPFRRTRQIRDLEKRAAEAQRPGIRCASQSAGNPPQRRNKR
ncbi:MAG: APC family permease [Gemmatimonadota bacterium]